MNQFFRSVLLFFSAVSLLTACTPTRLTADQLTGEWVAVKKTSGDNSFRTTLMLHGDGKFVITGLPRGVLYGGVISPPLIRRSSGTWTSGDSGNGLQIVDLIFEQAETEQARLPYGVRLFVETAIGPPAIVYFAGDPDDSPTLDFIKKQPEK